jgi:hypothetical protein
VAARAISAIVGPATAVLSLQNGVQKDDVLRRVLGNGPIMGGVCYIAATIAQAGVISHTGNMQKLVFGEYNGQRSARAEALLEACQRAGIDAELSQDIRKAIAGSGFAQWRSRRAGAGGRCPDARQPSGKRHSRTVCQWSAGGLRGCLKSPDSRQILSNMCSLQLRES